jgi:hypothetical protein
MSTAKERAQERAQAIQYLKERGIKPGATLYTTVRHCSRGGMQRSISVLFVQKGRIANISYLVAKAVGYRRDNDRDAVKGERVWYGYGFCRGL